MTIYRPPHTIEAALDSDVSTLGGQNEAARIAKRSQKHISNCLSPYKKESLDLTDAMLLWDEVKTRGEIPETVRFLAQRYGLLDEIAVIDKEVGEVAEHLNRVRNRTRPLSKVEALRA